MSKKFAAGGETAKKAFNETIRGLADMKDPIAQNAAGVALFGTMWEDLGPEVVTQLADITGGSYDAANAMEGIKSVKYDDLRPCWKVQSVVWSYCSFRLAKA